MSAVRVEQDIETEEKDPALPVDFSLLELSVGPVMVDDSGVRWSPLREIRDYPGVFHG